MTDLVASTEELDRNITRFLKNINDENKKIDELWALITTACPNDRLFCEDINMQVTTTIGRFQQILALLRKQGRPCNLCIARKNRSKGPQTINRGKRNENRGSGARKRSKG